MSDKRRTKKQKPVKSVKTDSTDSVSISAMQAKPRQTGSPCNRDNLLQDIFNNIDDGLSILDTELNIIYVNKWSAKIYSDQMPLVGKKCYKVYHNRKSPCPSCPSLRVLDTGLPQSELRQSSAYKDTDTWFDISTFPLKNDAGKIVGVIEHIRDISKHIQARRALEESEEKFKNIFKNANDGIAYLDCFGRILDINDKAMEIFAGSKKNLLNRHFTKLGILSFRDIPKYIDIFRDILAGKYFSLTVEITNKKGKHLFLECNASKIKSSNGPAKIMVIARDITERKKVEEMLSRLNKCFLSLGYNARKNIEIIVHTAGEILGGACLLYNRLEKDRSLLCTWGIWHEPEGYVAEDRPEGHICYDVIKEGKDGPVIINDLSGSKYEKIDPNVKKYHLKSYCGYPVKLKGKTVGSFCICDTREREFTQDELKIMSMLAQAVSIEEERKQAEEKIRESELKYRKLFDNSIEGIGLSKGNQVITANKALLDIFGYDSEEQFTRIPLLDHVAPESKEMIKGFMQQLIHQTEPCNKFEYKILRKDGQIRDVEILRTTISLENQYYSLGTFRDITEHKLVEEALKESEEKFRALAEHSPDSIMRFDRQLKHIYVNPIIESQTGIKSKDFLGKTHRELGFPKELCALLENTLEKVFNTGQVDRIEFQIPSGLWIDWFVVPEFEPNGRIKGVLATGRDITEHKKHEVLLRTSETQLSLAANIAKLGYWEYNIPEKLFHFNDQFYSIFRTTAADVGGYYITEKRFLKLFVCPEDRKFVRQTINSIIAKKQSNIVHNIEHRTIFPDGQTGYIAVRFFYVADNQSRPVRTFGIVQDITENKLAQEKLVAYQQKLRSLESELSLVEERQRRRIASDLHDHICQTLVLSKMKFQELNEFLPKEKARDTIEICNTLSRTIDSVRELIFDISSPTLYKFGLESALKELLEDKLVAKSGIAYKFYCDGLSKPLTENVCIILFSSVREILINIIKHAKAKKVNLAIEKHNDSARIIIIDDGIGFDVDNAVTTPSWSGSFGLFNIKERLNYIGGGLEIYSKPGYGSKFILSAPIDIQGKKLKGK